MAWGLSSTLRTKSSLVRVWMRAPFLSRTTTGRLTRRASTERVVVAGPAGVCSGFSAGVCSTGFWSAGVCWAGSEETGSRRSAENRMGRRPVGMVRRAGREWFIYRLDGDGWDELRWAAGFWGLKQTRRRKWGLVLRSDHSAVGRAMAVAFLRTNNLTGLGLLVGSFCVKR